MIKKTWQLGLFMAFATIVFWVWPYVLCPAGSEGTPRIPVKVVRVAQKNFAVVLSAMGSIEYLGKVDVSSEVQGILETVEVKEGDLVKKGQIIARINTDFLEAELKRAVAVRELAEIQLGKRRYELAKARERLTGAKARKQASESYYQTQKALFRIGAITRSELNEAEKDYKTALAQYENALNELKALEVRSKDGKTEEEAVLAKAKAELEAVKTRLERCSIRAPLTGIVVGQKKWPGEWVGPDDRVILSLMAVQDVCAQVEVSETQIPKVKPGQEARVRADAYPRKIFKGQVIVVSPVINKKSRTGDVRIKINDSQLLLKPGMFVRAKILLAKKTKATAIPEVALLRGKSGEEAVFVVNKGVAFLRKVKTGLRKKGWVEILSGLESGEMVVVEGNDKIRDLSPVIATVMRGQ